MRTRKTENSATEVAKLRARLEELEETLRAIRSGEVDALVVSGEGEERIFTLQGAEHPYRVLVEEMNEGAVTLVSDGTVIYANRRFSQMLGVPLERLIGASLLDFLETTASPTLKAILRQTDDFPLKVKGCLSRTDDSVIPVSLSFSELNEGDFRGLCMIATDLTEQEKKESELARANERLMKEIKHRRLAEDAVRREEKSLRLLSGRLLQMQDDERRNLARALHDSMGQELVGIKLGLQNLMRDSFCEPPMSKSLSSHVDAADRALMQVRNLSLLLHPPMLDEVGLSSALGWFVDGMAQRSKIKVTLDITSPWERLPSELETTAYRIVQECLTNVYRHSESSFANIRVIKEPDKLLISVRDGGKGLPPDITDRLSRVIGVGIGGMRERVRQFGGELNISPANPGTIVEVIIPMAKHTREAQGNGEAA